MTSEANLMAFFIDCKIKYDLYSWRNAKQPEQNFYFSGLNGGFQGKYLWLKEFADWFLSSEKSGKYEFLIPKNLQK